MAVSKPINIMHIFEKDNQKFIVNDYKNVGKIFLHPEVADRKIVVFLTLGAFRKGKSFLLDYCLRFLYANYRSINNPGHTNATEDWLGSPTQPLSGFSWKHGRKADTKGIIMWSDAFLHETSKGEKLAIVVMDTQGLFEGGRDGDENARIFGLSTLIASIQIINIQHLIQEDQLEYLNMAVSLSQMVMQKAQKEGVSGRSKCFQKLVFLMRDWADEKLKLGYEGGEIYLEEILMTEFNSKTARSVRNHIRGSFDEIKCCLLPHPGKAVNKEKFDGSYGSLEPEFSVTLKEFVESILAPENLKVKSILDREVTGAEFHDYVNSYFDAFQSDEIPKIESILEVTVKKQLHAIIENCVQTYHQEIKKSPVDFEIENRDKFCESLLKIHNTAKGEALKAFQNAPKLKSGSEDFETKLNERIETFFKDWEADNFKNYDRTVELREALKKMKLNEEEMQQRIKEIEENARKESEGNAKARAEAEKETQENKKQLELLQNQKMQLEKKSGGLINTLGGIGEIFKVISLGVGTVVGISSMFSPNKPKNNPELDNRMPRSSNFSTRNAYAPAHYARYCNDDYYPDCNDDYSSESEDDYDPWCYQ